MEISAEKTKIMTNNTKGIAREIKVNGQNLETVDKFKYLGALMTDEGSKPEVLSRIAQSTTALAKLNIIWKHKNITVATKLRLMRSLVTSIFLYACESWTLTSDLERRIQAMEMRCFRKILRISYKDHITNEEVKSKVRREIGTYKDLLHIVKTRKLKWYGHTTRSSGLAKTILQGTVKGGRKRGRQMKRWEDNISEWTGLTLGVTMRKAEDRDVWRNLVARRLKCPNGQTTKG